MSESRIVEAVQGRRGSRRGALLVAGLGAFVVSYLVGQQLIGIMIRSAWFFPSEVW